MTKQEAIETIKLALSQVEWDYPLDYAVAFDMAIEALEKQIPKKAELYDEDKSVTPNDIMRFPSAQPEHLDCGDCIESGGDYECDHVHCHKGKSGE